MNGLTMRCAVLMALATGMTACSVTAPVSDSALCSRLAGPLAKLSDGLASHPETPDAVGEAATDVVIVGQSGCASP